MKTFMGKDFLLSTKTSQKLYNEYAEPQPIFDYHCHLIPQEIAENRRFPNLAAIWLGGDHYKWRALRSNGVPEKLITGDADPYDKFLMWADTVPRLLGNPLYHWTHLELQRYFDIDEPLNRGSAQEIWKTANDKLKNDPELSVFGIFKKFKVFAVGTTDDPADTLEWHKKYADQQKESGSETKMLPSFRPDRAINIEKPDFARYIESLGAAADKSISNFDDLLAVLRDRVRFFDQMGCRISDHGIDFMPYVTALDDNAAAGPQAVNHGQWEKELRETFTEAMNGKTPSARSIESWKTYLLYFLGGLYHERGWAMQIHLAAIRNNNTAAFQKFGPDTGFDAILDRPVAENLSRFMNLLNFENKLPKTILYSLNPADLHSMATLMGCFQGDVNSVVEPVPGKIQLGSGWWFLDHIDGMEMQMKVLGNLGLLSRFVGMLTDSRSFLSYPRHEYFRRILCNILGNWAENGEVPLDMGLLGGIVRDISFGNAHRYFGQS